MLEELAAGIVTIDPADPTTFKVLNAFGAVITRPAVGQLNVKLQRPTTAANFVAPSPGLSVKAPAGVTVAVVNTDDCNKTIWTTLNNGTPVDAALSFAFFRIP